MRRHFCDVRFGLAVRIGGGIDELSERIDKIAGEM